MEKIISKKIIIKTIEEEVQTPSYITKDGMIFDMEEDALKHEEEFIFSSYFNEKYKLKVINSVDYGLNYGQCAYCHLIYIKELNDEVINDIIRFYELLDHPEDIMKFCTGWSFIAMTYDENLWLFDKTDRNFIVQNVNDTIIMKKKELELLENLL